MEKEACRLYFKYFNFILWQSLISPGELVAGKAGLSEAAVLTASLWSLDRQGPRSLNSSMIPFPGWLCTIVRDKLTAQSPSWLVGSTLLDQRGVRGETGHSNKDLPSILPGPHHPAKIHQSEGHTQNHHQLLVGKTLLFLGLCVQLPEPWANSCFLLTFIETKNEG